MLAWENPYSDVSSNLENASFQVYFLSLFNSTTIRTHVCSSDRYGIYVGRNFAYLIAGCPLEHMYVMHLATLSIEVTYQGVRLQQSLMFLLSI